MQPELNPGEYVFVSITDAGVVAREDIVCEFKEKEGVTIVIERRKADSLRLQYDFVAAWITLSIHSSLEAVGLTAAFSTELAKHNISCNVIAGYHHDHLFVKVRDAEKAMEVLSKLSGRF